MSVSDPTAPPHRSGKGAQLREHLISLIESGLQPHDRMPAERELAEAFGVTRLTARRVLDRLRQEGRVYRSRGAGTFVSEPRIAKTVELTSFSDDMRARGLRPGSLHMTVRLMAAGAEVGAALQLSPRDKVVQIYRVRTADDAPMCIEHSYLPDALVPGLADAPLEGSLYEALASRYGLDVEKAEQSIHATVLDTGAAVALGVPEFSPAFQVRRIGFDARGRRVEYAQSIYRADRYSYDMVIYRRTEG